MRADQYIGRIKMLKSDNKLNVVCAGFMQLVSIVSGFVVSKLILHTFGSEVNGLVSSINQFLSIISLLEGGLTAVVLSQLYRPIEDRDIEKISNIVAASNKFFRKVGIIFIIYSIILAIVYPLVVKQPFSFGYVNSLILVMSMATFAQYFFALTNRIVLQANQKNYIISIVMGTTLLLNLGFTLISIYVYPSIHILKLFNTILFFLQPIIYNYYVKKYFAIVKGKKPDQELLRNRWSGFFQNLTYFITMNTDMIVITFFAGLLEVSVYSIYMLVLNAIRQLITSAAGGYQSALGKVIAQNNESLLAESFSKFYKATSNISIGLFGVTMILIVPFVTLYTKGINDINYSRQMFSIIIILSQLVFCIREPYRLLVVSAGRFRDTNFGAILESILNLIISVILVNVMGLTGVAIGTLISVIYRYVYFLVYVRKHMIKYNVRKLLLQNSIYLIEIFIFILLTQTLELSWITSFKLFVVAGAVITLIVTMIQFGIYRLIVKKL